MLLCSPKGDHGQSELAKLGQLSIYAKDSLVNGTEFKYIHRY